MNPSFDYIVFPGATPDPPVCVQLTAVNMLRRRNRPSHREIHTASKGRVYRLRPNP